MVTFGFVQEDHFILIDQLEKGAGIRDEALEIGSSLTFLVEVPLLVFFHCSFPQHQSFQQMPNTNILCVYVQVTFTSSRRYDFCVSETM